METDWDILPLAPYFDLRIGFYFVENVHFEVVGDGYYVHFWAENGVVDMYDFWNNVDPPGLVTGSMRMSG